MLKFCNKKERNLEGARWGVSRSLELSCCQAQAEGTAALHTGSWSTLLQIAGCKGCYRTGREMEKNASCSQCSQRSKHGSFYSGLGGEGVQNKHKYSTPPCSFLRRIGQEIAFSPLAEEPLEESTEGLKWLGHVEHLAIPVLDSKPDLCSRS